MSKIINLLKENLAIKAGIGYIIGNFLNKGIVFFTIPIFTRLMTPDQFGLYSIYMTYELILVAIIGLSTHTSIRNGFYDFKNDFIKLIYESLPAFSFVLYWYLLMIQFLDV